MSCRQLAMAGRFLANGGRNPATGHSVVSAERARRIGALMLLGFGGIGLSMRRRQKPTLAQLA
jgi:glutaminase